MSDPGHPPAVSGPYSRAIAEGRCPLCLGTGKVQPLTMTLRDGPLALPGDPCEVCEGSGAWPPPERARGWHR